MIKQYSVTILSLISILFAWHFVLVLLQTPSYLIPKPLEVLNAFLSNINLFIYHSSITFSEAFAGFVIANIISIATALFIFFNNAFEKYLVTVAIVLKTIPIIAITPLLILWFGVGITSKIVTASLICFFPSLVNMIRGIKSIDHDLYDLFKIYATSKTQLIRMLLIPATLPYLFASLKVSSSLALVGALVGEFIGASSGLGFLIITNYYSSNTSSVFAAIILSSFIGIASFYIIEFFEKRIISWSQGVVY